MRSVGWRLLVLVTAACSSGSFGPTPARDERAALRHAVDSMLSAPETRQARVRDSIAVRLSRLRGVGVNGDDN